MYKLTRLHTLAYGGGGHCAMALPSDPKNKKCITVFGSVYCQYSAVYTKMFNFRRIALFCLEKRFSKHKMAIFSTDLGTDMAPLAVPWLRLCFGPPLGYFLRTPLASYSCPLGGLLLSTS